VWGEHMNELIPIVFNNKRIMTTKFLADEYGTDEKNIQMNYLNNQDRFIQGTHYYKLEGESLKSFKESVPNEIREPLKYVSQLFLWTEKGAARHAKILDTEKAWRVYEELEDTYFRVKEKSIALNQLSPELQMFNQLFKTLANQEIEQKHLQKSLMETKQEVQAIRDTVVIIPDNWRNYCVDNLRKIAYKNNLEYNAVNKQSYGALEERAACDLERRLRGRRERAAQLGVARSRISQYNYLDCIEDDKKLINIYVAIVKEMAIKYRIA
jgi:hypothetical protein